MGIDELVADHANKLSPQGRVTFSCGMMEAAYPLPLRSPPVLLVVFVGHTWAGDLSLTEGSITSPLPGCHACARRHEPLDIRLKHRGPSLHFSPSLSIFSITARPVSVVQSCSVSFSCFDSPLTPPSCLPLFRDRVTRASRLRNQRGGLFRQPGKCSISFFLLLHLSNSPLHLSIRV